MEGMEITDDRTGDDRGMSQGSVGERERRTSVEEGGEGDSGGSGNGVPDHPVGDEEVPGIAGVDVGSGR